MVVCRGVCFNQVCEVRKPTEYVCVHYASLCASYNRNFMVKHIARLQTRILAVACRDDQVLSLELAVSGRASYIRKLKKKKKSRVWYNSHHSNRVVSYSLSSRVYLQVCPSKTDYAILYYCKMSPKLRVFLAIPDVSCSSS